MRINNVRKSQNMYFLNLIRLSMEVVDQISINLVTSHMLMGCRVDNAFNPGPFISGLNGIKEKLFHRLLCL